MANYQYLEITEKENELILTINNPERLNALNTQVLQELTTVLQTAENVDWADKGIRALVLTGAGKAFIAGADIKEMSKLSPAEARDFSALGNSVMNRIEQFPLPVIAAVNGFALGGGLETVLACDFAYASEKAVFGFPEASLGLIPGFGGVRRLVQRVGIPVAKELIYTSRKIHADESKRLGIVNTVVSHAELLDKCFELVEQISKSSPFAVKETKVYANMCNAYDNSLSLYEQNVFGITCSQSESQEGMTAFLEKRKVNWSRL